MIMKYEFEMAQFSCEKSAYTWDVNQFLHYPLLLFFTS